MGAHEHWLAQKGLTSKQPEDAVLALMDVFPSDATTSAAMQMVKRISFFVMCHNSPEWKGLGGRGSNQVSLC